MRCFPVDMRRLRAGGIALLLTALSGACLPAMAQAPAACVKCAGPDQTYRCQAGEGEATPPEALRYFCLAQIAQKHVHQSCSVLRTLGSCDGMAVSYVYRSDGQQSAAAANHRGVPPPAGEPKTLADMTPASVSASVEAAGQAIGDATKRTLKCLGSAFKAC